MKPRLGMIVLVGILSRVVILALGILLSHIPGPGRDVSETVRTYARALQVPETLIPSTQLLAWHQFDAEHYLRIALKGYQVERPESAGFMPLLPLAIRAMAWLGVNPFYAGILLPNVAFALGLGLLGQAIWMVSKDAGTVWRACLLLCAFPTAFFYSAPYQESLGFLLVSAALVAWLHQRPVMAGGCLLLAVLARQTAIMFGAGLVLEWGFRWGRGRERSPSAWLAFAGGVLGCLLFGAFLAVHYGSASTLVTAQSQWGRQSPSLAGIFQTLASGFAHPSVDYLVLLFFVALGVYVSRRHGLPWGAWVLLPLALAASTGSAMSMKRVVLACFPAFYPLADRLKNRWLYAIVIVISLVLQVFFLWRFVHGIWVA